MKLREEAQIQNGSNRKRLAEALWFIAAAIGDVNVACPIINDGNPSRYFSRSTLF